MLNNSALFEWDAGGTPTQTSLSSAALVEVIEPELEVIKNVSAASADAGDSVTFTMTLQHTAVSETDAFDVTFSDAVPVGINYTLPVDVTVTHSTLGDISGVFQQTGQALAHDGVVVGQQYVSIEPGAQKLGLGNADRQSCKQ